MRRGDSYFEHAGDKSGFFQQTRGRQVNLLNRFAPDWKKFSLAHEDPPGHGMVEQSGCENELEIEEVICESWELYSLTVPHNRHP